MPAYQHQWKPIIASIKDRIEMLKNLEDKNIKISHIELKRKGVSYTIDTIREVKKETDTKIYWIVGSDILNEFDKWDNTDNITAHANFLVFPRDPYHLPEHLPEGFDAVRVPNLITSNISSTVVRERIQEGRSIAHFVPTPIEQYIKEKNLYVK
jgi:nicotinate-nucleotide adenylyltransferase